MTRACDQLVSVGLVGFPFTSWDVHGGCAVSQQWPSGDWERCERLGRVSAQCGKSDH